ncbi:MAG: DUF2149 domain-containing protein [Chitinophagales bacterium]|nr:DUF2149 domain-containing protein [Chitinophagales bacterium]
MSRKRRQSRLNMEEDNDPLSVVVNLFDVAMVFAVALMVANVMNMGMTEYFTKDDFTIVKNPGQDNMEIITREGGTVSKYSLSDKNTEDNENKRGRRVGIAYEMENGEVIYVPE